MGLDSRSSARTCIVGGGPAGAVLGLLLARAGLDVEVLEKHQDFLRDFRGDTIHASTLEVMQELGILEGLLARPHQDVRRLQAHVDGRPIRLADFSVLRQGRIVLMPQWDFLEFITAQARRYPGFRLRMGCEVVGLEVRAGRIAGVRVREGAGARGLEADLVVGCDGRGSVVRREAGLTPRAFGAPMDVLWFRLPREPADPEESGGFFAQGKMAVLLLRETYWQAGLLIPKGGFSEVRREGLPALRAALAQAVPFLDARRLERALTSWDDVRQLEVRIDRLSRWHRPGLLLIGDAAHAMSPIGGVGINLAIQDAVAAANILAGPLRAHAVGERDLARVQRRRWMATVATQAAQRLAQQRILRPALQGRAPRSDRAARLFALRPVRAALAYAVGIGLRPEHVRVPEAGRTQGCRNGLAGAAVAPKPEAVR